MFWSVVNHSGTEEIQRSGIGRGDASELAAAGKKCGGKVWSRHHATPDTLTPFRSLK
jgi:hypothetical protein